MAAVRENDAEVEAVDLCLECTKLLSNLTDREMSYYTSDSCRARPGNEQLLLFYRAVRGQEFLARQKNAVAQKEAWVEEELRCHRVPRKVVSKEAQDNFYGRLMEDAEKRTAKHAAALTAKLAKEAAILKSSKLWGISHKLCRNP
jgi:hypothetical protein